VGVEPERVQFSWVSASEGGRFAALIEKVVNDVKKLKTKKKLVKESKMEKLKVAS
jgi:coenzyme F420-reducing hydrogenase delta subunit